MANHLDRMVSTLGRNPLKVLVQVNTSGEECEFSLINTQNPYYIFWPYEVLSHPLGVRLQVLGILIL